MTQRPHSGWVVACLAIALAEPALAQTPQEDARREYQRALDEQQREQHRRSQEEFNQRQKATEEENRRFADSMKGITSLPNPPPPPSGGNELAATVAKARQDLEKQPPLPPQKNILLGGQWVRERKAKPARGSGNPFAELESMVTASACEMWIGDGSMEFRPDRMVGHDRGIGATDMGEVEYRATVNGVAVLPNKVIRLLMYEVKGPDRIEHVLMKDCTLVRVGAAQATAGGRSASAASAAGAVSAAGAGPPAPRAAATVTVAAAPSPAVPAVPAAPAFDRSVCRKTLLDRLGSARVDEVRAALGARFRETLQGTAPNAGGLRLDARGSPCDDARLNATLYDFDAGGVLREVTYVWARPPGAAPAPIFTERVATLARVHGGLPTPQSAVRLQADTSVGRLILQDMPERNLLLEAYRARAP